MKITIPNYINHVIVVADASSSMQAHKRDLIRVIDNQIKYLAERSQQLDQETRVTVYSFSYATDIHCLIWDKDVLRMPSIAELYEPYGMTALVDATDRAIDETSLVSEKYGDHAFLIYVFTDGKENDSQILLRRLGVAFRRKLDELPENRTVAIFVPNQVGVFEAKSHGFPAGNITVWDPTSTEGFAEAGERVRTTTEGFMQARTKGIRGSRSLFKLEAVDPAKVMREMVPLTLGSYSFLNVEADTRIDDYVRDTLGRTLRVGEGYYELTKAEDVQYKKSVAILIGDKVYWGEKARQLVGLPPSADKQDKRVRPADHADYKIFIQSTAPNRKLRKGTQLLIMR